MKAKVGDVWYRITDRLLSTRYPADVDLAATVIRLECRAYYVARITPKGVWLSGKPPYRGRKKIRIRGCQLRWVPNNSYRRFACPEIRDARESFIARKKAQIRHLKSTISRVEYAIGICAKEYVL